MTEERNALISKIKIKDDKTAEIEYLVKSDMNTQKVVFKGNEKVTEEFARKFQENLEGFIDTLPVLNKERMNIKMNSIECKYSDNELISKALYSVKYRFNPANNAVVNISTPEMPIADDGGDGKTFCISGRYIDLLYDVTALAWKYINGETRTKQMQIFLAEEPEG